MKDENENIICEIEAMRLSEHTKQYKVRKISIQVEDSQLVMIVHKERKTSLFSFSQFSEIQTKQVDESSQIYKQYGIQYFIDIVMEQKIIQIGLVKDSYIQPFVIAISVGVAFTIMQNNNYFIEDIRNLYKHSLNCNITFVNEASIVMFLKYAIKTIVDQFVQVKSLETYAFFSQKMLYSFFKYIQTLLYVAQLDTSSIPPQESQSNYITNIEITSQITQSQFRLTDNTMHVNATIFQSLSNLIFPTLKLPKSLTYICSQQHVHFFSFKQLVYYLKQGYITPKGIILDPLLAKELFIKTHGPYVRMSYKAAQFFRAAVISIEEILAIHQQLLGKLTRNTGNFINIDCNSYSSIRYITPVMNNIFFNSKNVLGILNIYIRIFTPETGKLSDIYQISSSNMYQEQLWNLNGIEISNSILSYVFVSMMLLQEHRNTNELFLNTKIILGEPQSDTIQYERIDYYLAQTIVTTGIYDITYATLYFYYDIIKNIIYLNLEQRPLTYKDWLPELFEQNELQEERDYDIQNVEQIHSQQIFSTFVQQINQDQAKVLPKIQQNALKRIRKSWHGNSNQLIANKTKITLSKDQIYITDILDNFAVLPDGEQIFVNFILGCISNKLKQLYKGKIIYEVMNNFDKLVSNAQHVKQYRKSLRQTPLRRDSFSVKSFSSQNPICTHEQDQKHQGFYQNFSYEINGITVQFNLQPMAPEYHLFTICRLHRGYQFVLQNISDYLQKNDIKKVIFSTFQEEEIYQQNGNELILNIIIYQTNELFKHLCQVEKHFPVQLYNDYLLVKNQLQDINVSVMLSEIKLLDKLLE